MVNEFNDPPKYAPSPEEMRGNDSVESSAAVHIEGQRTHQHSQMSALGVFDDNGMTQLEKERLTVLTERERQNGELSYSEQQEKSALEELQHYTQAA